MHFIFRAVVGTFLCGPIVLAKVLEKKCAEYSEVDPRKTKFYFNKENFWAGEKKKTAAVSFWEDLVGNVFLLLIKAHTDVESVHAKKKKLLFWQQWWACCSTRLNSPYCLSTTGLDGLVKMQTYIKNRVSFNNSWMHVYYNTYKMVEPKSCTFTVVIPGKSQNFKIRVAHEEMTYK